MDAEARVYLIAACTLAVAVLILAVLLHKSNREATRLYDDLTAANTWIDVVTARAQHYEHSYRRLHTQHWQVKAERDSAVAACTHVYGQLVELATRFGLRIRSAASLEESAVLNNALSDEAKSLLEQIGDQS